VQTSLGTSYTEVMASYTEVMDITIAPAKRKKSTQTNCRPILNRKNNRIVVSSVVHCISVRLRHYMEIIIPLGWWLDSEV